MIFFRMIGLFYRFLQFLFYERERRYERVRESERAGGGEQRKKKNKKKKYFFCYQWKKMINQKIDFLLCE